MFKDVSIPLQCLFRIQFQPVLALNSALSKTHVYLPLTTAVFD